MHLKTLSRLFPSITRSFAAAISVGALALGVVSHAQAETPDYSAFQAVLGASGTPSPDGSTITFPLIRQDLTGLTANVVEPTGIVAVPAAAESFASGYLDIHQVSTSPETYFVVGAFPAIASELPQLEARLESIGLPTTAVVTAANLSQPVITVHVEGTVVGAASSFAGGLSFVLTYIHNPQMNITLMPVDLTAAESELPVKAAKKFGALIGNGTFQLVDNQALIFSLPRTDGITVGPSNLPATPSLGVAQSVILSGDGVAVINVELALKTNEALKQLPKLTAAGYTLTAQSNYFVDDSRRLTFVHAVASTTDLGLLEDQLAALGKVLNALNK